MGYYSTIRIATTEKGFEEMKELSGIYESEYGCVEPFMDNIESMESPHDGDIVLGWDNVKFYEEFPETKHLERVLEEAENKGVPFIFMRIGEEWDDVEYSYSYTAESLRNQELYGELKTNMFPEVQIYIE